MALNECERKVAVSVFLGVDIGGSGVKGALVDVATGELVSARYRVATPRPATPDAVLKVVEQVVRHFEWKGAFGCTFPGVTVSDTILTAENMDPGWVGVNAGVAITESTGLRVTVLNDADAAAIAESTFGAGSGVRGTVLLLTFGTGIGSGLIHDGVLVANTELGHLEFRGMKAEDYAAARLVEREDMRIDWWASRVNEFLVHVERLFALSRIIFGGGIAKRFDEIEPFLTVQTRVVPAALLNNAGIVGAAYTAGQRYGSADND
ncbi:polyphosphate glucokinase [bacterium BMS3Bbin02]|nr:polyphosphate glucokinase [bacterium BMS3Bbin02]